ncbi:MAG: NADPH-dependent F420 reductase [Bryobacterales bacterium]|nr:NADPH-dependent F420 reductase [Bryobacterales bacterium]
MNIAFLGYGNVGAPLADHLQRAGHAVTLAAHDPQSESVKKALGRNGGLKVATPREAVSGAEVVFLATPFAANAAAIAAVAEEIRGKVIVDCTNPVGPGLTHGLNNVQSGSEALQAMAPDSEVVKAFTIYGFENFEDNSFPGYDVKPAMMFCGRDAGAKHAVARLISDLGWEPLDTGGLEQALHLEHMTLLWIRMVRVHGAPPRMVWAALRG